MALMNLSGYQSPRYPEGPMTIAAVAQLLGSVLGGVSDWRDRKEDRRQFDIETEAQKDYRAKSMALQERAAQMAEDKAGREQIAWETLHDKPVLFGPTPSGGSATRPSSRSRATPAKAGCIGSRSPA